MEYRPKTDACPQLRPGHFEFTHSTATNAGFGLRNMQERAINIGAVFGIKSRIGKGTRIRLLWTPP